MAEIRNEFTWSFSRQQCFESCPRRYYLRYYEFWDGWSSQAPDRRQRAYRFSKMQNLPMLIGSAVHTTLERMLRGIATGRTLADPVQHLRDRLNEVWKDSRDELWRERGPKRAPPLFEHYYDVPVRAEWLAKLRDKAIRSLENVQASSLWNDILGVSADHWRAIDELATVQIGSVPAFVAPDFAFDHGDELWLIDWKTGGERADLALQLQVYALYARMRFDLPAARIRAFDYFTVEDRSVEVPIDDRGLATAEAYIAEGVAKMQASLADVEQNLPLPEDAFAPTEDPRECRSCFFQEICDVRIRDVEANLPAARTADPGGS